MCQEGHIPAIVTFNGSLIAIGASPAAVTTTPVVLMTWHPQATRQKIMHLDWILTDARITALIEALAALLLASVHGLLSSTIHQSIADPENEQREKNTKN